MIAQFHQRQSYPTCQYVLLASDGKMLGKAEIAEEGKKFIPALIGHLYLHEEEYIIRYTMFHGFPLFHNGMPIGAIDEKSAVKKTGFLKYEGYPYQVFTLNGEMFELCEVGFGKNQHYFCLHRGGVTAAIVHMSDLEVTFCNDYTIYGEDENAFIAASIAIMYKEGRRYNNREDTPNASLPCDPSQKEITRTRTYNSLDASLRARFDPNFIPRIQVRDGGN